MRSIRGVELEATVPVDRVDLDLALLALPGHAEPHRDPGVAVPPQRAIEIGEFVNRSPVIRMGRGGALDRAAGLGAEKASPLVLVQRRGGGGARAGGAQFNGATVNRGSFNSGNFQRDVSANRIHPQGIEHRYRPRGQVERSLGQSLRMAKSPCY